MKIAIVVRSNIFHGAERRAVKIFRHLLNRGRDVELWVSGGLFNHVQAQFPELVPHIVIYDKGSSGIGTGKKRSGGLLRKLLAKSALLRAVVYKRRSAGVPELIMKRHVDVAHVFLDFSFPCPPATGKCATVFEVTSPDIANHLGAMPAEFTNGHSLFNAVSDSVYAISRKHIQDSRLVAAPLPYFRPVRVIASLPQSKRNTVTFAARLVPRKNGLLFAKAVDEFLSRNEGWHVNIFGDGPEEEAIKSILSNWIDENRVRVEKVNDITPYLMESRIFVSVIQPDNYPSQSVMEAMYSGNALLLSNTGMSEQQFIDQNGHVVELSQQGILHGLEALVSSGNLDELGANSRQIIEDRFSADRYIDYIEGLYEAVVPKSEAVDRT